MARFDFMGGGDTLGITPRLPEAPTFEPGPAPAPGLGERIGGAMQDPNVLRMLATFGGGFAQGQPFGQAAGTAAQQMLVNRALQQQAAQQSARQSQMQQALIDALAGRRGFRGSLVGPPEDLTTPNRITIGPKATTVEMPTIGARKPFEDITDEAPEARTAERLGEESPRFPFL